MQDVQEAVHVSEQDVDMGDAIVEDEDVTIILDSRMVDLVRFGQYTLRYGAIYSSRKINVK